jgi:hypothetical protein
MGRFSVVWSALESAPWNICCWEGILGRILSHFVSYHLLGCSLHTGFDCLFRLPGPDAGLTTAVTGDAYSS